MPLSNNLERKGILPAYVSLAFRLCRNTWHCAWTVCVHTVLFFVARTQARDYHEPHKFEHLLEQRQHVTEEIHL